MRLSFVLAVWFWRWFHNVITIVKIFDNVTNVFVPVKTTKNLFTRVPVGCKEIDNGMKGSTQLFNQPTYRPPGSRALQS